MNETQELVHDYHDCIKYIQKVDEYDYNWLLDWATLTYVKWLSKNQRYALSITGGQIPPKNSKEKVINALTNLKVTLEKIAVIMEIQL